MKSNQLAGAIAFVLLGGCALLFLLTQLGNGRLARRTTPTYTLTARFDDVGDLKLGAHVAMAGIEVGRVAAIEFDTKVEQAVVSLQIDARYDAIPADSSASINTQGILGGKIVNLRNGHSAVFLRDRQSIGETHSALSLEGTISRLFTAVVKTRAR